MSNHYLVTGGCGFIGSHIAEALAGRGERVTIYDNLSTGKKENLKGFADKVSLVEGDIRDYGALSEVMRGVTHVFHEAANVSVFISVEHPETDHEINSLGTLNVLRAAREHGVKRLLSASSCAVYGNNPDLPKNESMLPEPASPYAADKMANEYYLRIFSRLYGLETVVLRYFNVYGPRQDPGSAYSGVISIFVNCLLRGKTPLVFGTGEQTRDFVYVGDVVRANLLAMEHPGVGRGEVFNIGTGHSVSLLELLATLERISGKALRPEHREARAGDVMHSLSDISRAREVLGYVPSHTLEQGLASLLRELQAT